MYDSAHRSRQTAQFHICCCSLFTNIKNYKVLIIFSLTQNKTIHLHVALLSHAQVQKVYFTYLKYI